MSYIKKYNGRAFVDAPFNQILERIVTGLASNKVWAYTVEKVLEKNRGTEEFSERPIIRIVRWRARNDEKNKNIKYWRYGSSYNIRSDSEWSSSSEAVENLMDEQLTGSNFVMISKEDYERLHGKIIRKTDRINELNRIIRELKDVKSAATAELNSFKKKFALMKSNIKEYESVLKKLKSLIDDDTTTETEVHKFLIENKAFWLFGLEYVDIISEVSFPPKKNYHRFDMMLQRHDNFWDLIELKGPNEKLFDRRTRRRNKPNQKLSEAIGQVFTYLNLCDNMVIKNILKPKAYIVIGKDKTDDLRERKIFSSYLVNLELITYSDLYNRGKKLIEYIKTTSLPNT